MSELDPGGILTPVAPIICAKMDDISRTIGKKIDYRETTYYDDTPSRSSLEKFIMPSTNPFISILPTFLMMPQGHHEFSSGKTGLRMPLLLEGQEDPRPASRNPEHKHGYDVDN